MNTFLKLMQKLKRIFNYKPKIQLFLFNLKKHRATHYAHINSNLSDKNLYFPELDVLKKISTEIKHNKPVLKNYFLVAGQHILNTTGSLLEWIINELDLPANNIYLIGKSYSSSPHVAKTIQNKLKIYCQPNSRQIALGSFSDSYDTDIALLWNKLFIRIAKDIAENKRIEGIFVLDDGGHLLKKIPADLAYLTDLQNNQIPLIGIEQTASGINYSKKFPHPIIEVATSAAKNLEAPMLANVTEKLLIQFQKTFANYHSFYRHSSFNISELTCGVVGLGKVGSAILKHLKKMGYSKLIAFDYDDAKKSISHKENIYFAKDVAELTQKADLIFGCTGTDFMNADAKKLSKCLHLLNQSEKPYPKVLISLSSKDTEFNSLLTYIHQKNRNNNHNTIINPLNDILYPEQNPKVIVLSGGTPFNFTQVNKGLIDFSIEPKDIQLIRGLLVAAILQAHHMMLTRHQDIHLNVGQYKLDPVWQSFVVQAWRDAIGKRQDKNFLDLNWISKNSGGILWEENTNKTSFHAFNM